MYQPRNKTKVVLDRAWELVASVNYPVSARWLFYRLLQEGYYSKKSDYKNLIKALSSARKSFYAQWRPDTLADETREANIRGNGFENGKAWVKAVAKVECKLDKWFGQDYYIELWFEAKAMIGQFEYYTENITLCPLGGQPSIPYKWECAKRLERASQDYGSPIIILYFGDLDEAGGTIREVTYRDVQEWCAVDFEFLHCGLNNDQVNRYKVPENPEKPGQYQWEALSDEAAHKIITSAIDKYLRHDSISKVKNREQKATARLRRELQGIAAAW